MEVGLSNPLNILNNSFPFVILEVINHNETTVEFRVKFTD